VIIVREPGETPTGDGLLTDRPELPLTLTVADCVPLFLALSGRAVALIHCGWRGVAGGIVAAGVQAVTAFTGTAAEEIDAWIGPSIGPCCYWLPAEDAASLPAAGMPRETVLLPPPRSRDNGAHARLDHAARAVGDR